MLEKSCYLCINVDALDWVNPNHRNEPYAPDLISQWIKQLLVPGNSTYAASLKIDLYVGGKRIAFPILQACYIALTPETLAELYKGFLRQNLKSFEIHVEDNEGRPSYYRHSDFIGSSIYELQFLKTTPGGIKIIINDDTRWCSKCNHIMSNQESEKYPFKRVCFACNYTE